MACDPYGPFIESYPVPLVLVDGDGNVLVANGAWTEFVRRTANENGTPTASAAFDFSSEGWHRSIRSALERGRSFHSVQPLRAEFRIDRASGDEAANVWISRLETDENRAATDAEALQLRKLKDLSEMAASIAHEVNNPLTVIYARALYLRKVLDNGVEVNAVDVGSALEKICVQSERIFKIVNGIRSFSRDSRGDAPTRANLRNIVGDTLTLVNASARDHGVQINVSEIDESLTLDCKPSQLMQVLVNLLNNAIDATKTVPFPRVNVDVASDSETIRVWISDNGAGVSPEIENKIFTPFFTTKPIGEGTGIGLSTSRRIVMNHGGRLALDRSKGPSCFVMEIPRKARSAA